MRAEDLVARVVSTEQTEADQSGDLTSAKVVVGAGRGVGGAEKFDDVLELTELLGAALGVSRVVTSAGWRPHHEQVGQTGSRISPDLYVPCGISGAIQHWAGCSTAKTILAINSDAEAPMVTRATYAVIGDLHEIVPAINAEIRKRGYWSPLVEEVALATVTRPGEGSAVLVTGFRDGRCATSSTSAAAGRCRPPRPASSRYTRDSQGASGSVGAGEPGTEPTSSPPRRTTPPRGRRPRGRRRTGWRPPAAGRRRARARRRRPARRRRSSIRNEPCATTGSSWRSAISRP